jgi:hypothetical protein
VVHEETAQTEEAQVGLAFDSEHFLPHPPQLFESPVAVFTSHPLVATLSQSAKPALQAATVQAELAQPAVALAKAQAAPQPLQLFGSLVVFTQRVPLQSVGVLAEQPVTQPVGEHTGAELPQAVGADEVLQPPQFAGCVMSVSQPFLGSPSQSAKPTLHDLMTQPELLQEELACARLQTVPQTPQLFGSLVVSTSHPVETILSQSAKPVLHAPIAQADWLQPAVPWAGGAHVISQAPQFFGSLVKLAQVPLQFDWPLGHPVLQA